MDSGEYVTTTEEVRTAWYQLTINVDSFDRWLAERDREIAARAWDEGFDERERGGMVNWNPYREETE